jgi:hypothetical protein
MKKRIVSIAMTALVTATLFGSPVAEAVKRTPSAPSFDNCDQMHRRWEYGVAKSRRAARRQVATDHYRPRVSRAGYRANRSLDADDDGTACEVSR